MSITDIRRIILRIIGWTVNIICFTLISLLFYISIPIESEKNIQLKPDTITGIISQLSQKNYAVGILDKYLMIAIGKPQSGWIYIGKNHLERLEFLDRLTSAKSSFTKTTLVPGETTIIYLKSLAEKKHLNEQKLLDAYKKLSLFAEAGILAESYNIPKNLDESKIINNLLSYSLKRYKQLSKELLGSWSVKEWNRILIIASIVQKEAADTEEMPKIASVIYNRLKKNMRLQMDGTLNYGKYSHIKVTPEMIKNDKSTYNTYKHRGLPKYPVASVSIPAIKASISPHTTDYLYFMRNRSGKHNFSSTYKNHLKNIKNSRISKAK